jgi:TonB-dependent receptor
MRLDRLTRIAGACALALTLAVIPARSHAQETGSVSGIVVDGETGFTLGGASVSVQGSPRATITNQQGRFALLNLPAGRVTLEVMYLGYGTITERVTVAAGQVTEVRLEMAPAAVEVEGFTVTGQRRGQAAALNQQLTAANVTNVVAADQIGRFPDSNVGDALKRIPGISVIWDQGEARFGLIRGTEPRLNSVMINGERIPSAEAEVREVQLDLIPSDMVSAVEVNKTLTPDMDADAIGGAVNIVTRAAPAERRISATVGSGYNFLRDEPMSIASGVFAERFGSDDQFGMVLSGSWFDHNLGSDNVEAEWDEGASGAFVEEFQIRRYDIRRLRRSLSASFDWRLDDRNTLTLRGMYNHRDDWESRWRTVYAFDEPNADGTQDMEIERQTKGGTPNIDNRRREDQRTHAYSLNGDHLLGAAQLNWSVQWAQASEDRPNERYIQYLAEDLTGRIDISDGTRPVVTQNADPSLSLFTLDELSEENQYTRDRDLNGRLDLEIPFAEGASVVKFGGRYRQKEKIRDNDFFLYEPTAGFPTLAGAPVSDYSDPDFIPGNQYAIGRFFTEEALGELDLNNPAVFDREDARDEYLPDNFDADERIIGGYAMLTQQLGDRTSLLAGLRIENTDVSYNGFEFVEDTGDFERTSGGQNYTNFFPNVQLRHELDDRTVLRAAFTSTMARPNYFDLVPYRVINRDDNEIAIGNPDLQPTTSLNFDLMAEKYFRSVGLISGGVFYKDITDFIFEYTREEFLDPVTGQTFDEGSRPENGAGANLLGFEVAFQRQLDFIGDFGRYVGLYANYTFTESSVDGLPIEGRENEDLPLPGTSRHTLNGSLSIDTDRLSVRGSLNLQDDFIDPGELGDSAFFDRYYDRQITIDANASYQFTPSIQFFIEANNLTNQPLAYYQGISSRLMQEEFYSRRFQAGLKYDLR